MNKELIKELKKNLDEIIYENKFKNKFIILFGSNTPGDIVVKYLKQNGIKVNAVVDNNPTNIGKTFCGLKIYKPDQLLLEYKENLLVLICSKYYSEMCLQLQKMGYNESKHIFKVLEMSQSIIYSNDKEVFEKVVDAAYEGLNIYNKILDKCGDIHVFVSPIKANGDIYMICSYIEVFAMKNNIENYILTVIGQACYRVAKLFSIKNVEILTQNETEYITHLHNLLPEKISIVQPYFSHLNFYNYLDGYKGLNFGSFFKYGIFGLSEEDKPKKPYMIYREDYLKLFFKKNGLKKGKTVILSPFANSLPQIEEHFWVELAKRLNEKGWTVCTNSLGEDEPAIIGTTSIFFLFDDAVAISEYAGAVVAIRSGLCEVVSNSNCKKIIIYPDKSCGFGSVKDVYSIVNMGIAESKTTFEIENSFENIDYMIEYIINTIEINEN